MPRAVRLAAPLLALLLGLAWAAPAGAEAQVYKARYRPVEELVPLAETAMAGEGKVAADPSTNSLVLVGPPQAIATALALLESQDVAPVTLVLHYETRRVGDLEAEGVEIDWNVGGSVRVGNAGGRGVRVRPVGEKASGEMGRQGTLRVLSGRSGRIATGTDVPVTSRRVSRTGVVVETLETVSADSGFEVSPRVLGDGRIHLELRPFEGRQLGGGVVARTTAATTLVVERGATVVVGGLGRASATQRQETLGDRTRERSNDERVLLIRVEVDGVE